MDTLNRKMNIERAFSAISDSKGDLLFYTNGNLVANKNNDTLGRLYHTDTYPIVYNAGYVPQSTLILPMPNDSNLFSLFHFTAKYVIESSTDVKGWNIYRTLLDKRLNNGMGGIVYNSQTVLTDTLALMGLTAVKHANGRDWWIVMPTQRADEYYTLLLSPQGLGTPTLQKLNNFPHQVVHMGFCTFGRNGELFVRGGDGYGKHDLYIMNFDRCNGSFYNEKKIFMSATNQILSYMTGIALSANEKYVYVSTENIYVYQYDLTALDIATSAKLIATYDNSGGGFGGFSASYLAPDDKIYIADNTNTLTVINQPNLEGIACNIQQHSISIPTINGRTIPNYPNFYLGALVGSACDTLTSFQSAVSSEQVKVYPNPVQEQLHIEMPPEIKGEYTFTLLTMQGQTILAKNMQKLHETIFVGEMAKGMYLYRLETHKENYYGKICIE